MLWVKSFHIIFVVSWFAGLFYLPRIFVNHAMATEPAEIARLDAREASLGAGAARLPPLLRLSGQAIRRRPQHAQPCVLPLVQRSACAVADRHRHSGHGKTVLIYA